MALLACAVFAACAGLPTCAAAEAPPPTDGSTVPDAAMLRYPDVGKESIVFLFANDLWTVPKAGGEARPLTSAPGVETLPRFSPDGRTIAFVAGYEGGRDIYTMPAAGGVPFRVTHHPTSEGLCDWTPDGASLIFSTPDMGGLARQTRLFKVPAAGGLPEPLPVPYGANAAINKDGTWLAYTPHSIDSRTWKRYRGGMATDIWLYNLKDGTSKRATTWEGLDSIPMWHGDSLYYLSDDGPSHRLNIWKYDPKAEKREQITTFDEFDVKWPAIGPDDGGPGEIVFQYGSKLMLLDLASKKAHEVQVRIPGNRPRLAPHLEDVSRTLGGWEISPTGKRVLADARGDIWSLPAENGTPRNLTRSNGVAEREPAWSPDGKWIAFFDDSSGEYEVYTISADGKGEKKQLTKSGGPFKTGLWWSPDSKKLAFTDKTGTLSLIDVESGDVKQVDKEPWAGAPAPSFSADSAWITYARSDDDQRNKSVWVYEIADGSRHRVTSGMFDDGGPVFSRNGDWIFFATNRHFQPRYSDLDDTWIYDGSETLAMIPLRKDVKHPWLAESDEEKPKDTKKDEKKDDKKDDAKPGDEKKDDDKPGDEKKEDGKPADDKKDDGKKDDGKPADDKKDDGKKDDAPPEGRRPGGRRGGRGGGGGGGNGGASKPAEPPKPVKIDFDGIEARAIALPVRPGRFGGLAVNNDNQLIYVRAATDGGRGGRRAEGAPEESGTGIKLLDLTDKKHEEKSVGPGARFIMSADGKKLLAFGGGGGGGGGGPGGGGGGPSILDAKSGAKAQAVVTSPMETLVDPRTEWKQIVNDCYRIMRDYFYDQGLHNVDWAHERDRALALLEQANSREDLNFIISEMISELNVGHAYLQGAGDVEGAPSGPSTGMLGVDFEIASETPDGPKAYRIKRIIDGAAWDVDARNPLREPGIEVAEGEYLLAVNGAPLVTTIDPWAAFAGLAGKSTTLTISKKPVIDADAREIVIKPIASETTLRFRDWVERNRKYVQEKSQGRIGYVYVPNTGTDGQTELVRQFQGARDRDGLIVDERWNGGGQIPNRFIELLNRPTTNYWARRDQHDWTWPPDGNHGPKVMLINGLAGSGGDMFPWLFKHHNLGPLIGTRTWGGLVGISGNPQFVDGGNISVPQFGFYKLDGTWGIEGHGVDPDIEVLDDPGLMKGGLAAGGADPQLDRAIAEIESQMKKSPAQKPPRPPSPDRKGMGVPAKDH